VWVAVWLGSRPGAAVVGGGGRDAKAVDARSTTLYQPAQTQLNPFSTKIILLLYANLALLQTMKNNPDTQLVFV
jgi:hypothetical protein